MNNLKKIVVVLPDFENKIIEEIKALNCKVQESKSDFFDADLNTVTLLVSITPAVVASLTNIIVSAISKEKKTTSFKYNGLELTGYSKKEILEILNLLAEQNKQLMALNLIKNNKEDSDIETDAKVSTPDGK